jgi:hypothetical protein
VPEARQLAGGEHGVDVGRVASQRGVDAALRAGVVARVAALAGLLEIGAAERRIGDGAAAPVAKGALEEGDALIRRRARRDVRGGAAGALREFEVAAAAEGEEDGQGAAEGGERHQKLEEIWSYPCHRYSWGDRGDGRHLGPHPPWGGRGPGAGVSMAAASAAAAARGRAAARSA